MKKYQSIAKFIGILAYVTAFVSCTGNPTPVRLPFPFATMTEPASQTTITESAMQRPQLPSSRVRAPEFPRNFAWVNTDRPLYMQEELRGRVVVLDFWTYCCINCMHILPDLEYIEKKYAGKPVVVIGVHSAKFDNESDKANILTACHRYHIEHPVIVDEHHRIWSEYGVQAWPTLAVIDAEGRVVGQLSGEGNREILDGVIEALLDEGREKGVLAAGPPEFNRHSRVPSATGLAFPGKVLATRDRVFIADSNHDRIIIADTSGQVLAIAGSGRKGTKDGGFTQAEFNNPQGMAFDDQKEILYVADTDNHLIRKLDLSAKSVETISGRGVQVYDRLGGGIGTSQGLNSPWDLALRGSTLYIAMAGPHQLWTLDIATGVARAWAGSGREDVIDGVGTRSAALAQPSGLALSGEWLYFADSEVSAVRRANVNTAEVQTLVGTGLFDFGDQTGKFDRTLLQHPLGVAVYDGDILVADTYNHKIKKLDPDSKLSFDFIGSGNPELAAEDRQNLSLYEPGGISISGDLLYIADTNHDRIIRVSMPNGNWTEFALRGLRVLESEMTEPDARETVNATFRSGIDLELELHPMLPQGVHLNKEAPIMFAVRSSTGRTLEEKSPVQSLPVSLTIPAACLTDGGSLDVTMHFAYCTDENKGLCVPVSVAWTVDLKSDDKANGKVELTSRLKSI